MDILIYLSRAYTACIVMQNAINLEKDVAIAAPATSSLGNPSLPLISTQLKNILITFATRFEIMGVITSPTPLKEAASTMLPTVNTVPAITICI